MREPKPGEVWFSPNVGRGGKFVVVYEDYFRGHWGTVIPDSFYVRSVDDCENIPYAISKNEWCYFTLVTEAPILNAPVRNDPWSKGPEGETLGPSGLRWL